jgi:hypothetical protein
MEHVLFNSSVKTNTGLKVDPKWKESQITKKIQFLRPDRHFANGAEPSNSWQHSRSQKKLHADSGGSC